MDLTEQKYYAQLYTIADIDKDGKIGGAEGVIFLRKSGLSDKILEKIWELSDISKLGYLTPKEFSVAMRLITMAQKGKTPDLSQIHNFLGLPQFTNINLSSPEINIYQSSIKSSPETNISQSSIKSSPEINISQPSIKSSPSSPSLINSVGGMSLITMEEQEKYKYDNLFYQADINKDGFVDGNEARNYFSKAKVSNEILANIWDLSELDKDGKLSKNEFRLAMHLIYWVLKGQKLPSSLPQSLIISSQSDLPSNIINQSSLSSSQVTTLKSDIHHLQFSPSEPIHNFDQSKLIAQHTLPNSSFEFRANFNNELNDAIHKIKQKKP